MESYQLTTTESEQATGSRQLTKKSFTEMNFQLFLN
jgi:hypothetical protein